MNAFTNIPKVPLAETSPALGELKINGFSPFYSHSDGHMERLEEAHALLMMLSSALHDNDEPSISADSFITVRGSIKGKALEGVQTLIALAIHQHELSKEA